MDEYDCETVIGWLIDTYIPWYEAQAGGTKPGTVHTNSGDSGPPPPPPKKN